jgi:predicted nucleic acid-binding Zn ribbon protein
MVKMDRKSTDRFKYKSKLGSGSRPESGSNSLEWMRAMALRQWRHGDPVKDPVRNIHHAGEFIDKLLEEVGASGSIEEKQLHDAWEKVAGDFIAKNSKPESLKQGVLVLRVVQPALRFQLEQMKGKLLKNFKRELGEGVVKTIVLKV